MFLVLVASDNSCLSVIDVQNILHYFTAKRKCHIPATADDTEERFSFAQRKKETMP